MNAQRIRQLAAALLAVALVACGEATELGTWGRAKPRMTDGKALFEEKCRTVAGEKIYRKVENVEGLLLMKVRPPAGDAQWSNRDWPGAAFAREATVNGYIDTFLGWEYASNASGRDDPITPTNRGYIANPGRPGGLPGYRWVEVLDAKDGQRYRYTGSVKVVGRKDTSAIGVRLELEKDPKYDLNIYAWSLDKTPSPSSTPPRFGVTFEDHVIPEDRYLGVASSTIKVIDLQTNEVLGEMTRYAWSPGAPSRVNPSPWLTAYKCPGHAVGADSATRKFVDQVLIPVKEK